MTVIAAFEADKDSLLIEIHGAGGTLLLLAAVLSPHTSMNFAHATGTQAVEDMGSALEDVRGRKRGILSATSPRKASPHHVTCSIIPLTPPPPPQVPTI